MSGALTLLLAAIGSIIIAYLLRSIPTGYLAGKVLRGIDIREHGSRSTGATNVLRTLGKGPAAVVLAIDIAKGAAAVGFAQWLAAQLSVDGAAWIVALAGLTALLGHARSVWLRFSGGKSAATGLGVLLALAWRVGFGAAMVFGVTLALVRIVSLGSILAALTAMVLGLALGVARAVSAAAGRRRDICDRAASGQHGAATEWHGAAARAEERRDRAARPGRVKRTVAVRSRACAIAGRSRFA